MDEYEHIIDRACRDLLVDLQSYQFKRERALEDVNVVERTVVYVRGGLGLVMTLDLREERCTAEIVKVLNGKLQRRLNGGYSLNVAVCAIQRKLYYKDLLEASTAEALKSLQREVTWVDVCMARVIVLIKSVGKFLIDLCENSDVRKDWEDVP